MIPPSLPPPPHRNHPAAYLRVQKALYRAYILLGLPQKAHDILDCGSAYARYQCADCKAVRDYPLDCKQRLCPYSAHRRANRIIAKYHTALSNVAQPKMLTLTYNSVPTLTRDIISDCNTQFAAFRRSKLWANNVEGGISGLELTYGKAGWHPHRHSLIDADYIPVYHISRTWKRYSQGAMVVHIKALEPERGIFEVVKYTCKSSTFYEEPHLVMQYLEATRKTRFLTTFGSFYRAADPLKPSTKPTDHFNIFTPYDDIPPGVPRLFTCPICGGHDIQCLGKVSDHPPEPPPVQIPF